MRKQFVLLFALLTACLSYAQQDPVLMTVGDRPVTRSEFLQIYLKNNPNPKFDKASLDEYMELFKKFKLKVIEAENLGYDSIPKLRNELDGYRRQLATPYLIDSAKNKALVREGYERMRFEVSASHILIRVPEDAAPADTLLAYNRIIELRKRILKGEDFEQVAKGKGGSEDESVRTNGGALGYFSAFQMVYPFESAAYNTAVGQVSMPVRTKFGYHLVKVHDKRAARGIISAAHLMIVVKQDADMETQANAEKRINEIYERLMNGESWEDLVMKYSEDYNSKNTGGKLPEFGTGSRQRMVPEFEDAAFSIPTNGAYSKPVKTAYGWHIVKRLDVKGIESFESLEKEIQQRVNKDERALSTQKSFIEKLKKEYNLTDYRKKQLKWFHKNAKFVDGQWVIAPSKKNPIMFSFSTVEINRSDFTDYLSGFKSIPSKMDAKSFITMKYDDFIGEQLLAYEEAQLETKYPAFKALMTEYHDGVLLYEIMNDKVWNKALRDTLGLRTYFNANREQFRWGDRLDADIFVCDSRDIAMQVVALIKQGKTAKEVSEIANGKSALNVILRSQKLEINNTDYLKGRTFVLGVNEIYEHKGKFYVVVNKESIPATNKELDETRGAVTAAYQQYLEQQWLEELIAKYAVVINSDVLYNLGK
jgi:peptidyl-prolyl cis-trans isomerase SurA